MLSAQNLSKKYGDRVIFENVSVNIKPGEITCLIGPSGAGKTTLLKALALLESADAGYVTLDDQSYHFPLNLKAGVTPTPWPIVTVVFQSLFLWPHLSLRENILLPARLSGMDDLEGRLDKLVTRFDMGAFINNFPNQASVGQRQRVALARALILQPRYILMDEITSALDTEQVHNILGALAQLKNDGIGLFLITHQIGFARRASDQVIFMADGKICESGAGDILMNPQTDRLQRFLSLTQAVA